MNPVPRLSSHLSPLLSTCWFSSLPTRASPLPCMGNRTADTFLCLCTGTGLPLARKFTDPEARTGRARNRQLDPRARVLGLEERGTSQEKRRCQASLVTGVHYIHYHFTSVLLLLIKRDINYLCKSNISLFFMGYGVMETYRACGQWCSYLFHTCLSETCCWFKSLAQGLYQEVFAKSQHRGYLKMWFSMICKKVAEMDIYLNKLSSLLDSLRTQLLGQQRKSHIPHSFSKNVGE